MRMIVFILSQYSICVDRHDLRSAANRFPFSQSNQRGID